MNLKWRRIEGAIVRQDDWPSLDASRDRVEQLFNTGEDDLIDSWRSRVWLDHKMQ